VRGRWPLFPALILAGLLFAAFHLDGARLVPLIVIGALFAYAYERSGSLWCSIVPHAGLNAMWLAVVVVGR
jgi:membrane protease YdiL (CAAX protease family)